MKRQKILFLLLFLIFAFKANATHQRAAQITYKHLSGNTYKITVTMFTRTSSPADDTRDYMPIKWGDNTQEEIPRIIFQDLGSDITLNVYTGTHTFPGTGTYIISVEDPNRNNGVINIPNSVNVPMYIESLLVINPFLGPNNSVLLTNAPIDVGCVNKIFVHNPAAYDPDGDSLSYKLVICKGQNGQDIPGYTFPMASEYFKLDSVTGDLLWKNPILQGEYNVAFVVEEWRQGVKIGYVRRDMQINIIACDHDPPVFDILPDTCIYAGDFITFPVSATDPDSTMVTITGKGGPFFVTESPAEINPDPGQGPVTATTTFLWQTQCSHIRKEPYRAVFKAKDNGTPVGLVSFGSAKIAVISPAPENLTVTPLGRSINISWDTVECPNALGYKIYRKEQKDTWTPSLCETGVPSSSGFHLIKEVAGNNTTHYTDDNNGEGLSQGILYCYRITATFYGNTESKASDTACCYIKRDAPLITHVTNDSNNITAGNVWVKWSKPTELDTSAYPGPYKYHLIRNIGTNWENPEEIAVLNGLDDTGYFDNNVNINILSVPATYRVELHNITGYLNSSDKASSVFVELHSYNEKLKLTIHTKVPWINDKFIIYRKDPDSNNYQIIDTTYGNIYYDNHLKNFLTYCYYVKALGHYSLSGVTNPLVNYSQIACGVPQDIEPPCKPVLSVKTDCDNIKNKLSWILPYDSCNYDVAKYVIYYSTSGNELTALDSVENPYDTTFIHENIDKVIGCYGLVAVDSTGNRSEMSDIVCVGYDACPPCRLPNVFTPNSDNINDLLIPFHNASAIIDRIELLIINRWGQKVYYTEDPQINWDGTDITTGKPLPDGTYFYKCKAFVVTNEGEEVTTETQGSITIISGNSK